MAEWSKEGFDFDGQQKIMTKLIRTVKMFHGFTPAELSNLLASAGKSVFSAGDVILNEGGSGSFMYVIMGGEVEVSKKLANGEQQKLAKLVAGDSFGEMALVDNELRSATVTASAQCLLVRIGESDIQRNHQVGAKLFRNIASMLAARLRNTNAMIAVGLPEETKAA